MVETGTFDVEQTETPLSPRSEEIKAPEQKEVVRYSDLYNVRSWHRRASQDPTAQEFNYNPAWSEEEPAKSGDGDNDEPGAIGRGRMFENLKRLTLKKKEQRPLSWQTSSSSSSSSSRREADSNELVDGEDLDKSVPRDSGTNRIPTFWRSKKKIFR